MSQALIRAAFETTLATWAAAQAPAIPVAWENVVFTEPSTTYLRSFVLPADTDTFDIGMTGREYLGVYQVSIALPIGAGPGAGETIVSALDALFPATAPIESGGLKVWITRPMSAANAIQEPDRYVIPVSLGYRAYTT